MRWGIVAVGALILASDIGQDLTILHPSGPLLAAAIVRNLLLLVALAGVALNRRWGYLALGLSVVLGLVRRGMFFSGAYPLDSSFVLFTHSGADLAFRLLAIFVLIEYFRKRP